LLLAVAYHVFGLIGAAAFAVLPIVMRYVTKQYLDRAVDNVRRLRTLNEQLEHRAFHDPLTNLANRALFTERLEHAFRRPGQATIVVLFIDLDNFKIVNDTLGHAAGDALLTIATQRLRQCVRWEDTIARLGGDEFTVLLENVRDIGDVARSAERIAEALRRPFDLEGQEAHVSASIGVALDTDRGHGPDDLMREADMAMYRAKQSGKSRYEIFDPGMNAAAMERLGLETDLRFAVEREELTLLYQPLLNLTTGALESYRAHLCWQHPRHGLLDAAAFSDVADGAGTLATLERWALEQACRDARLLPAPVSSSLSPRTLELTALGELVDAALASSGLPAARLVLGCAESDAAREPEAVQDAFSMLRARGIGTQFHGFGKRRPVACRAPPLAI
jgi:diguanylate cyclase (GGDEF)-like protein